MARRRAKLRTKTNSIGRECRAINGPRAASGTNQPPQLWQELRHKGLVLPDRRLTPALPPLRALPPCIVFADIGPVASDLLARYTPSTSPHETRMLSPDLNGRTPSHAYRSGASSPLSSVVLSHEHIQDALSKSPDNGGTLDFAHKGLTDVGEAGAEEIATLPVGQEGDNSATAVRYDAHTFDFMAMFLRACTGLLLHIIV